MAKKVQAYVKLQISAGEASPGPPVGTALGPQGVNLMEFCKAFNAFTQSMEKGLPVPVEITIFSDKSFTFITKTPPTSYLLKKAAGLLKGSATPNKDKVGKILLKQVEDIAEIKMKDLTASNKENAVKTILGTARSMGIEVGE